MAFRHFLIASSLLVAPAAVAAFSPAAFAAPGPTTADVNLSAAVQDQLSISATPSPNPIDLTKVETVNVANLTLLTNNPNGLKITISSVNGALKNEKGTLVPYSVGIGANAPASFTPVDSLSAATPVYSSTGTLNNDTTQNLYIKHAALTNPDRGTYTDKLTLTVADNQ